MHDQQRLATFLLEGHCGHGPIVIALFIRPDEARVWCDFDVPAVELHWLWLTVEHQTVPAPGTNIRLAGKHSGALYLGANIEIPGNGLNQAVHAEQSALANAFAHAERGIVAIAVIAAPCGHCRQFLNEITGGSQIRVIVKGGATQTLEELLPASFGPKDLGITAGLFSGPVASIRLLPEHAMPSL
jgi:cytidine deaminase